MDAEEELKTRLGKETGKMLREEMLKYLRARASLYSRGGDPLPGSIPESVRLAASSSAEPQAAADPGLPKPEASD